MPHYACFNDHHAQLGADRCLLSFCKILTSSENPKAEIAAKNIERLILSPSGFPFWAGDRRLQPVAMELKQLMSPVDQWPTRLFSFLALMLYLFSYLIRQMIKNISGTRQRQENMCFETREYVVSGSKNVSEIDFVRAL